MAPLGPLWLAGLRFDWSGAADAVLVATSEEGGLLLDGATASRRMELCHGDALETPGDGASVRVFPPRRTAAHLGEGDERLSWVTAR